MVLCNADFGGLEAAGADEARAEDALVAQDAGAAVLDAVQEGAEVGALRLRRHHLLPLPADLRRQWLQSGSAPIVLSTTSATTQHICAVSHGKHCSAVDLEAQFPNAAASLYSI